MKSCIEEILEKADSVFEKCGFDIKAKDVYGMKFVLSLFDGEAFQFGTVSSFDVENNPEDVILYPCRDRNDVTRVDKIIIASGKRRDCSEKSHNEEYTVHVFRNDKDFNQEIFFDFID